MAEWFGSVEALVNVTAHGRLPERAIWEGRTVLVTGHTGFKGAWLARWLALLGAEVHGLALDPPTRPSLFEDACVADVLASDHRVDLRDAGAVTTAFEAIAPSVVIHLAAQPLVRDGMRDPTGTFATNVQGTVHLLSAVRTATPAVEAVVIATTDKVYEPDVRPHQEDDPLGGHDPYAWSKVMVEQAVTAFRSLPALDGNPAWRTPIATARAGNVIGGGDWSEERLVPDCIRAFAAGTPVRLRFPDAVRPWQHVLEPLAGYLLLAESLVDGSSRVRSAERADSYNFGPDDGQIGTVGDIADALARCWGGSASVSREVDTDAPAENQALRLDSARARADLAWYPRWDLTTTLDRTVGAYRAMTDGVAAAAIVDEQIAAYTT